MKMKKLIQILLAVTILLTIVMPVMATATIPVAGTEPDLSQPLTSEVLTTQLGMILVVNLITQGIKMVFMRKASTESIRNVAFIVSLVVVIIAKLILGTPFGIADILIIPGNAIIVWLSAMKAYEKTIGAAATPAGNQKPPDA